MSRQYLTAKFRPDDKAAYTYHNDGPPVAAGDRVLVPGRRSAKTPDPKPQTVTVYEIEVPKPEGFETKAILGPAPPAADPALGDGRLL